MLIKRILFTCTVITAGACLLTGCMSAKEKYISSIQKAPEATLPHHLGGHEKDLLTELHNSGADVIHEDTQLRIIFPEDANFSRGSTALNKKMMTLLDDIAGVLQERTYSLAAIHGYADSEGPVKVNQALSERRAHSVIAYLEAQGIPANRFVTVGHNEARPRATNATPSGRKQNRRVEITIHKPKDEHVITHDKITN